MRIDLLHYAFYSSLGWEFGIKEQVLFADSLLFENPNLNTCTICQRNECNIFNATQRYEYSVVNTIYNSKKEWQTTAMGI